MSENELAKVIVDLCLKIHKKLGPGLLESVYEAAFVYELNKLGINVKQQVEVPVMYDQVKMDLGFRADLLVANKVIIELKSVETLMPVHEKQLLTYLKLANMKLGLLINFNENLIKNGTVRIVNGL
jgi:GxxExxY protein